ncbi:MAG: hypothetical protein K2X93_23490 [Candidatus Obscuribacterales bacterium]|nr:hypothetical protein [Candidatus Obscuribacterales bacterium]
MTNTSPQEWARSFRRLNIRVVVAFSLFLAQQLPAQAGDNHHQGFNQRINRLARNGDLRHSDWSARPQRIRPADQNRQTLNINTGRIQTYNLNNRINLDLRSQVENIMLGAKLFSEQASVKITVGGAEKILQAGSRVTAGEYVAAKQVLTGGQQTLVLGVDGSASSGHVDFGTILNGDEKMRASSLVNPQGVTVAGDFGKHSDFQLRGDLTNFGSLYAYSTRSNARAGSIRALDINNQEGATISTVLPEGLRTDLHATNRSVDLRLHADNDLNNYGTIEGGGRISLTAGNRINNASANATVKAENDVSLAAADIVNRGAIASTQGSIYVDSTVSSTLTVDNRQGFLRADNGAINIRSHSYSGAFDTYVCGGDLVSSTVNLNSGQGLLTVEVGDLTGTVIQKGTAVHLLASTENLVLGETCLAGDPTYYNTAGNIAINGTVNVNEALTIVASGNITFNNGADLLAGDTLQGFPITLIAGANITATAGGANQSALGPIPPVNNNNGGVTINGASAGGGQINFASPGTVIDTRAINPVANTSGADVLMVAFGGANAGSGAINAPFANSSIVFTGGTGFGNNGNITFIAPGAPTISLLPGMNTTGGLGGGGNITATAADPLAINVVYLANGKLSGGGPTIVPQSTLKPGGTIQFANNVTAGNAFIQASAEDLVQLNVSRQMTANGVTMVSENDRVGIFGTLTANSFFFAVGDDIQTANAGLQRGIVRSPNIGLTNDSGDIGLGGVFGFRVDGLNGNDSSITVNGHDGVSIFTQGSSEISVAGSSNGTGTFEILSASDKDVRVGSINVNNGDLKISASNNSVFLDAAAAISTANGTISVSSGGGDISTGNAGTIDATNGIQLSALFGSITVGPTAFTTTSGDVSILAGTEGMLVNDGASLHTDAGNININAADSQIELRTANLSTGDGNINIINQGVDKKKTKITFFNTQLNTLGQPANGDITISVGVPGPNVAGKAPKKNLVINPGGGQVFFSKTGITANAPNSTLTVNNADIIFNNSVNKKSIVLSGVNFTAD